MRFDPVAETFLQPLPPLHALAGLPCGRASGRFRDAAAALGLSELAISHQVRKLEDYLGAQLFQRNGNSVALTPMGTRILRRIDPAFAGIRKATERLRKPSDRARVR